MSSYIKKDLSDTDIIKGEHATCTETEGFAKEKRATDWRSNQLTGSLADLTEWLGDWWAGQVQVVLRWTMQSTG